MTATLELLASPHDRLDPLAAAVRWWTAGLDLLGARPPVVIESREIDAPGKRLPASISVILPASEIFVAEITLPPGGPDVHRKALALRLADLAPVDPTLLDIAARRTTDHADPGLTASSALYAVIMARTEQLAALEEKARRRGASSVRFQAEGDDRLWLLTRRAQRARTRARIADMILVFALAASAILAAAAGTRAIERETAALLAVDQAARRANLEGERAARDAGLAQELVARGVLERRAGVALADLAALNGATPDSLWWTRAHWTPEETTLAGAGRDAAGAIEALSAAASGWSVALAGPVRASDEGLQTFELRAEKRVGGDDE